MLLLQAAGRPDAARAVPQRFFDSAQFQEESMTRLPARIGMWAAVGESISSLVYIVGLVIMIASALSQHSAADLAAQ